MTKRGRLFVIFGLVLTLVGILLILVGLLLILQSCTRESQYDDFIYIRRMAMPIIIEYTGDADHVIVPETINSIPAGFKTDVFQGNDTIETLEVYTRSIPDYAFKDMPNLRMLSIPNVQDFGKHPLQGVETLETLTTRGTMRLHEWFGSSSADIPLSLTTIHIAAGSVSFSVTERMFHGASGVKEVTFSEQVRSLGDEAFTESGIETLRFAKENELQRLNPGAFGSADHLVKVDLGIGSDFLVVEANTFAGLENLREVRLPASVETIQTNTFSSTALETLVLHRANEDGITELEAWDEASDMPFYGVSDDFKVYVPDEMLDDYRADELWSEAVGADNIVSLNTLGG